MPSAEVCPPFGIPSRSLSVSAATRVQKRRVPEIIAWEWSFAALSRAASGGWFTAPSGLAKASAKFSKSTEPSSGSGVAPRAAFAASTRPMLATGSWARMLLATPERTCVQAASQAASVASKRTTRGGAAGSGFCHCQPRSCGPRRRSTSSFGSPLNGSGAGFGGRGGAGGGVRARPRRRRRADPCRCAIAIAGRFRCPHELQPADGENVFQDRFGLGLQPFRRRADALGTDLGRAGFGGGGCASAHSARRAAFIGCAFPQRSGKQNAQPRAAHSRPGSRR